MAGIHFKELMNNNHSDRCLKNNDVLGLGYIQLLSFCTQREPLFCQPCGICKYGDGPKTMWCGWDMESSTVLCQHLFLVGVCIHMLPLVTSGTARFRQPGWLYISAPSIYLGSPKATHLFILWERYRIRSCESCDCPCHYCCGGYQSIYVLRVSQYFWYQIHQLVCLA